MANQPRLLDNVKVLEISTGIAAPLCGRMMADLGAEVVKLEIPPGGDAAREWMFPPAVNGVSPAWVYYNRGKQDVCIDISQPQGAALVRELAGNFDVLVENLRPGELAKHGLGYDALKQINPGLIMCSISPYGQTGPLAASPGDDTAAQALTGLSHLTGNEDGSPVVLGQRYGEGVAAVNALGAICAALFLRARTGVGQHIDLTLYETIMYLHETPLMQYIFTNGEVITFPTGAHRPGSMPCGMFRASDGYIVFTILQPRDWEWFIARIGYPEMATDPRWDHPDKRFDERYEIIPLIEKWLQSFPSREEPVRLLQDRHLLAMSVLRLDETANHPQFQFRQILEPVEVPSFGRILLMKVPYRYSDAPVELASRIAKLGEDNAAVLHRHLGYGPDKIAALRRDGVLIGETGPIGNASPDPVKPARSQDAAKPAPARTAAKSKVLAGVKVLEITNYLAGPTCARILGDMGAEVIKVEIPPSGDYIRRQYYFKDGLTAAYVWFNRGKHSVSIDVKRPEGARIVLDLAPQFDIVVQNMSPGTLDKHGLGYEAFRKVNPRIIMCSISAYGQDGPFARFPGNDTCSQGMAGVIQLTGNEDGSPVYSGIYLADMNGAVNGFAAVMAALYARERTGLGQHIDLALTECLFHLHDVPLIQYLFSKGKTVPQPEGRHGHGFSPSGMFETSDGFISLTVANDTQWRRLAELMGQPAMATDPRYADAVRRHQYRRELMQVIEQWLRSYNSREAVVQVLRDNGFAAMPVYRIDEAVNHPHVVARGSLKSVDLPAYGPLPLPVLPFRYSDAIVDVDAKSEPLGGDNHEVLGRYLNYSPDQVDELLRRGVLFEDPLITQRRTGKAERRATGV